jgi:catechol 2,3-dioxygenase-like lactoylglutathione lyase family enzyme
MIQIDGLGEVVLNVRDASRAVAFYGDLLGLERMTPEGQLGPIFFRAGQATTRIPSLLVLVPLSPGTESFRGPRTLHHLALTVPAAAFDAARATLTDAGVEVRDGKHPVLAVRTMYVTDPDGNEVELISPEPAG